MEAAVDYIKGLEDGTPDRDMKQWIYEGVMIAVFGPNVFDWINKKL